MRIVFSMFFSFFLTISAGLGQQRESDKSDDVIRVSTDLVQTDVTVLDKDGKLVKGLQSEQFELLVDGKPQSISFFEQVTAGSLREAQLLSANRSSPKTGKNEAGSDSTVTLRRGRIIFFFVDDLHLRPDSMVRTRRTLQWFVDNLMANSDQVAIATASGQLGFLQQLTSDKSILGLAIDRLKPRSYDVTDLSAPPMTEYQAHAIEANHSDAIEFFVEKTCLEFYKAGNGTCRGSGMSNNAVLDEDNVRSDKRGGSSGGSGGAGRASANAAANALRLLAERQVRSRARVITRQAAQIALSTVSSLESLIRRAAPLPDRKLLIFVSDGFFINFISSSQAYDLRRITDAATRTGTVIYTVDARGLISGMTDATKSGLFDTSGRLARINLSEVRASQEPLQHLADETGGRAWLNSNALDPGIAQAISETSAYYLLAWRPANPAQTKEGFRRITVTIEGRPDLVVRVRGGFFTEDQEDSKTIESSGGSAIGRTVDDQLLEVIRAPYPKRAIPMILSAGYLEKANDGLVVAASVQIAREVGSSQGGSAANTELDVIGALINDSGNILSSLKQRITIPAGGNSTGNSVVVTMQFPKLASGLYQMRVAVRDSKTGRLGSAMQWIEIPNITAGTFTLSSIFLTEGANGSSKSVIKPDRQFARTTKLGFQTYVYHASQSSGSPKATLQIELRHNGQVIIQTPPSLIATDGVKDLARLPVVGEFPLNAFSPGSYVLKLTVTDSLTKKSASRQIGFTVQ